MWTVGLKEKRHLEGKGKDGLKPKALRWQSQGQTQGVNLYNCNKQTSSFLTITRVLVQLGRWMLHYQTWAYRKVKIRGAETNLPDFPDFARQVQKKFSGEKLF
jgi:hypothetical protein